jgi:KUP system potassium uptake protein
MMAQPDAGSSTGADIPSQTQPTTTIRIADNLHRLRSEESSIGSPAPQKRSDTGFTASHAGGIYSTRSRRLSASGLSIERPRSLSRRRTAATGDAGDAEEGDRWQDGQQHTKQVFRGRTLLWLAYQSTGVIYGDIGTR